MGNKIFTIASTSFSIHPNPARTGRQQKHRDNEHTNLKVTNKVMILSHSGVFIVNFGHIEHYNIVFFLLTCASVFLLGRHFGVKKESNLEIQWKQFSLLGN